MSGAAGDETMKQTVELEDEAVEEIPSSALIPARTEHRYGSVPDLDDEELADPDELERQVYAQEWAPILALPMKAGKGRIQPNCDESGSIDWGAFATVDFERTVPEFDKARYKADRLKERLSDLLIMLGIVKERLPGKAKYLVLKYLKMGIIDMEDIVSEDMVALARLWLRAKRLKQEIIDLREASAARRARRMRVWLEP
jgi:hypothetical protein